MLYQNAQSQYLRSLQRRNSSPCTIDNYRGCLSALGIFLGEMELEQVQLPRLREWIDTAIDAKQSPYTIWSKVVLVRAFFNWCVKEGFLNRSPAAQLDKPKLPQRIPKASTDLEIQALLQAASESLLPERNIAMVYFLLETGARRGAVASLELFNLHLQKRTATVITKGNKEIKLFFGEITKDVMQKWLEVRDPRQFHPAVNSESVFGLTADGIYQAIIRMKEHSGIQRPLSPHVLRHTSATLRAEQGIDSSALQQIMGWNDIRMAEIYTCMASDRLKRRALETSPVDNNSSFASYHSQ
jgi:site-specific recombinase XerD